MAKIVVFGNSDIAKLCRYYFSHDSDHEVVAFTADKPYCTAGSYLGLPLIPFSDITRYYPSSRYKMFIAISYLRMNHVRAEKYYQAKALGYELVSYVSSHCTFLTDQIPGDNCFILEDNTIQPFVKIGNNVTIWSGNHIGHESMIDDHCFLASHIVVSGHVHVKPYCFIGVNATIRNAVTLASETLIGAGAIIMKDTEAKGVYLPARSVLFHKKSDEIEL